MYIYQYCATVAKAEYFLEDHTSGGTRSHWRRHLLAYIKTSVLCSGAQAAGRAGVVRRAGGGGGARGGRARQAARPAPAQPLLRLPLRAVHLAPALQEG